jgi:hypothetical protein
VPNAGLDDLEAELARAGTHLGVGEEPARHREDAEQRLAPEDLERAIDIADVRPQ